VTGPPIARLSDGGRIWALGAQQGNDRALEALARALLQRWQRGDKLVVLGNMLGGAGDPGRALDLLLLLRRRLLATNLACDVFFLRGAQEEMWHKLLGLQFVMSPLSVLDWMLARGLAATVEAYGGNVEDGRIACRAGAKAIARWTVGLRTAQMARAGHAELLNSLMRAALSADGTMLLSAAGVDATRPIDDQADAFWWNGQSDRALDAALTNGGDAGWQGVTRLVRGAGPGEAADDGRVLTVTRQVPALVALDGAGTAVERIEA
jgi:serine/threonine protein phosphatase 1